MSLKQRIIRNLAAGTFGRAATALGPLLLVPCFLKVWGTELYGEWLLLTSIPACIMLAPDFGITGVAANLIAKLAGEGRTEECQDLFNSVFWFLFFCASAFALMGSIAAYLIPWQRLFSFEIMDASSTSLIISLLLFQLVWHQLSLCLFGAYRASLQNARSVMLYGIQCMLEVGCVFAALVANFSPVSIALVMFLFKLFGFFFFLYDFSRLQHAPRIKPALPEWTLISPLLLPALGWGGMPILHLLQNQGILTLVGMTVGPSGIAVFQSLRTMTNGVKSLFGIFSVAVLTELSRALGSGDEVMVGQLLNRVRTMGLVVAVCSLVGMIAVGGPIFRLWTAGATEYNGAVAIILAVSLIPYFWATPASIYLHAANRLHPLMLISFVCMTCSLSIIWLGGHTLGIVAAALSTALWEFLYSIILVTHFRNSSAVIWKAYVTPLPLRAPLARLVWQNKDIRG